MDGTVLMLAAAAAVPLGLLGWLVVVRRWPLTRAAWVCAGLTIVIAILIGGLRLDGVLVALGKGVWTGTWILLIVVPALLLFQIAERGGAVEHLSDQLSGLAGSTGRQLLLFAWVLPSFIQGVAGFGVPVVIAAPMLVRAGLSPVAAVSAVLVGYHWSVTFGSMGSSFLVAVGTSGVDAATAARFALYSSSVLAVSAAVAAGLLVRRTPGTERQGMVGPLVAVSVAMGVTLVAVVSVEPALGSTAAGLVGVLTLVAIYRRSGRRVDRRVLTMAAAPYAGLTALVLIGLALPPVRSLVDRVPALAPSFPATTSGLHATAAVEAHQPFAPLAHPFAYLLVACIATWILYRRVGWLAAGDGRPVLAAWGPRALATCRSLLGLTVLSALMVEAGLMAAIADAIVALLGLAYLPIAPVVGALGTALTGSTTASNALLAPLQAQAGVGLGLDAATLLTAQTVGGNVGNVFTPINVAVAAAAVGAVGRESEILRSAGRDGVWLLLLAALVIPTLGLLL